MKPIFLLTIFAAFTANVFAQKETFDAVTYKPIIGWEKVHTDNSVSFSKTDEAKGTFCIISIYPSREGTTDSRANFNNSWQKIVQEPLGAGDAKMETPGTNAGWQLQTGSAQFNKGGLQGIAMLVTATNNNKMLNMLVLFNSDTYNPQLNAFIASIELQESTVPNTTATTSATSNSNASVVGIWTNNLLETSGYANGYAQYTAGYFRKEYTFKSDGTYFYSQKNWSAYSKVILYACETGTWSTNGSTLTLSPIEGKAGEWNRTGSNKEWGSLLKTKNWKLERTTYTLERKYYSGSQNTALLLNNGSTTERDGTYTNQSFSYTLHEKPLIDFPPDFKISVAKPATPSAASNAQQTHSIPATGNAIAPIAEKIYEGTSLKKTGSGNMQINTGGFLTNQYAFYSDGRYRFVNVNASSFTDTKSLSYETGTYTVNGNRLTITPARGANEEWNKSGKTSNGNSDVGNRKINNSWNTKVNTGSRKLESCTYTFSIGENGNRSGLVLQHNGCTEREVKEVYLI